MKESQQKGANNMSIKARCNDCVFFDKDLRSMEGLGICRRTAPTVGGFAVVDARDSWCGEILTASGRDFAELSKYQPVRRVKA